MNENNSRLLINGHPNLYSVKDPREPFIANGGFECNDGWFNLLLEASAKIEAILSQMNVRERANFGAAQVKEKFGTLRFYMNGRNEDIEKIITEAERKSGITCEQCGEPGTLRGGNWLTTSCDSCDIRSVIEKIKYEVLCLAEEYEYDKWDKTKARAFRIKEEDQFNEWALKYVKSKLTPLSNKK